MLYEQITHGANSNGQTRHSRRHHQTTLASLNVLLYSGWTSQCGYCYCCCRASRKFTHKYVRAIVMKMPTHTHALAYETEWKKYFPNTHNVVWVLGACGFKFKAVCMESSNSTEEKRKAHTEYFSRSAHVRSILLCVCCISFFLTLTFFQLCAARFLFAHCIADTFQASSIHLQILLWST